MKVWVVTGNDYPDAIFDSEKAADDYCTLKKRENAAEQQPGYRRMIYWRSYEFELRQ